MIRRLFSHLKSFLDWLDYILAEGEEHHENLWEKRRDRD